MLKIQIVGEIKKNVTVRPAKLWKLMPASSATQESLVAALSEIPNARNILASVKSICAGGTAGSNVKIMYNYDDLNQFGIPIDTLSPKDCKFSKEHRKVYLVLCADKPDDKFLVAGVFTLGCYNRVRDNMYGFIELHLNPAVATTENYADVLARLMCYLHNKCGLKNPVSIRVPHSDVELMKAVKTLSGCYAAGDNNGVRNPEFDYASEEFEGEESTLFIFWNEYIEEIPYEDIVEPIA